MTKLWENIQKTRRHGGGAAVLKGFPGSGKTTLLGRFAERTRASGTVTLYATGSTDEQSVPLGVVEQWFADAHGGAEAPPRLTAAVQAYRAAVLSGDTRDAEQLLLRTRTLVESALRDLAGRGSVVAVVDDAHHTDTASTRVLRFLAKRLVRLRLFLVLADGVLADGPDPGGEYRAFQAALLRSTRLCVAELAPLDPQDTARLVREVLGHPPTPAYVRDVLEVTAGNPRLLCALARDTRYAFQDAPAARWAPVPGTAFCKAVALTVSAQRSETVEKVARALAVLGDARSPGLVARLAGVDPVRATACLGLLEAAGLVAEGRFRHPAARAAVLADSAFTGRAELSRGAARLLYRAGAAPLRVARCLTAAGGIGAAWEVSALREAARQAQSEGAWEEAVDLLELARSCRGETDDGPGLLVQLVLARWQLDPYTASRHLADLVALGHEGRLPARELTLVAQLLAWHGRLDEVDAVLALLRARAADDEQAAVELGLLDAMLSLVFTRYRRETRPRPPLDVPPWREALLSSPALGRTGADNSLLALVGLTQQALSTPGDPEARSTDIVHWHLRLLRRAGADRAALPRIDAVSATAAERLSPFHQSLLHCLQAVSALSRGDLPRAEKAARAALVRPRAWGVAVGLPLSVLVIALARRGKAEEAAEALHTPVPAALFTSYFGLLHLDARGQHHLAAESYGVALSDFLGCGEAERQGGFEPTPACLWQVHAAEAHLRLGQRDEAVRLAREAADSGSGPARAVALRVLALARPVEGRGALLREAMSLLEDAGDRTELAACMVELGRTHYALGNARIARSLVQRAARVARGAGFEDVLQRWLEEDGAPEPVPEDGAGAGTGAGAARLSPAERRVAWLVGVGYSNREIAAKLFVTVSTVEQHLTRIYRKLKVKHREELAAYSPPLDETLD
ncbi:LuxR C-terminal-related transcriptional regulator [Streptomyces sp. 4F14]|uniref:helix-turn-helix transcriptional regulator n=1 Tax=Streptomyces sp. 4F14 TaxID=3394380 RepID=UPI003A8613FE